MKFIFGVAVGYFLFHPLSEKNTKKALEAKDKFLDFVAERVERRMGQ